MFSCRPTSSGSEDCLFTVTVVVEGWSDALQKDHGNQLSGDGEWFEHTSLFPLFFQKGRMIPLHQSWMVFLIHTYEESERQYASSMHVLEDLPQMRKVKR